NEYKAYAGSALEYEFKEIGEADDEIKREAQSYGVNPVQANIAENDQFKVQNIFLGIAFLAGDKKEVLPFIQKIEQLEYDFTGAIKRLSGGGKQKIAFLTGHDEVELAPVSPYAQLENKEAEKVEQATAAVSELYELEAVDLTSVEKIPDEIQIALLLEPKKEMGDKAKYIIDQFLMRGGKLAVFINQYRVDLSNNIIPVMNLNHGLNDFFKNYGFEVKDNIVVDENAQKITMRQQVGPISLPVQVNYPFIPRLVNFNKEQPIVSRMNEMMFFFSSSVDTVPGKNVKFIPLIQTSDKSGFAFKDPRRNMYNIQPNQQFVYNQKHINLAGVVEGRFKSAFPAKPDTVSYPDPYIAESSSVGKILVAGDADFFKDNYAAPGNIDFLLNGIDWLVDENGLISIRSKKVEVNPLDKEIMEADAATTRSVLKAVNVFLAPLIIIGFGLMRWLIRRKTKQLSTLATKG
ncbi:MAG: Gldg family protein, partial [Calditrichaeota bacterium]|nr:Gldg family protein [Calditrichota bacterium]